MCDAEGKFKEEEERHECRLDSGSTFPCGRVVRAWVRSSEMKILAYFCFKKRHVSRGGDVKPVKGSH